MNVAVFIAMVLAGVSLASPTPQQLVHWGANCGPLTLGGQWWRLVTAMFLHIGIIHLGFNMWCLWDLGALAETLYGSWTFAAIYLISGVAASVTSVAWHPSGISAGASGAIFGLAGALIASLYLGVFAVPRAAVRGTLRSVLAFAGYNLVFGAIAGRVDNSAHIGGLVSGLLLGAIVVRVAPRPDQQLRRITALVAVLLAAITGAVWLQHSRGYLIHAQHGAALISQDKTDQAITELQGAIRQRPDFVPAHFELARAYFDNAQPAEAETELKRILALEPKNESAYYELGLVYLDEKRNLEARDAFTQILALNHNSAGAHFGLGNASAAEGEYRAAIEEYKVAAGLDAGLHGVYYNMGHAYAKLAMYDDAIASYLKEQKSGDTYETELALAGAYRAKGMPQQSDGAIRKAAQLKAGGQSGEAPLSP